MSVITNQKILGCITAIQYHMLMALKIRSDIHPSRFWKVVELGGFKSTSHSIILKRLVNKQFVEEVFISEHRKAYKISAKGIDLLRDIAYYQALPQSQ